MGVKWFHTYWKSMIPKSEPIKNQQPTFSWWDHACCCYAAVLAGWALVLTNPMVSATTLDNHTLRIQKFLFKNCVVAMITSYKTRIWQPGVLTVSSQRTLLWWKRQQNMSTRQQNTGKLIFSKWFRVFYL